MNTRSVVTAADEGALGRLDHWLWAVRLYKTRSRATEACRGGHVTVDGVTAKPARELRPGMKVVMQCGLMERTVLVRGHPAGRVGAKLVELYCEELTPPTEWEKARSDPIGHFLAREKGAGRPTKRDRRSLDQLFRE